MEHTFSITNDRGDSAVLTIDFDFSTATEHQKEQWAVSNRAIAIQRVLRPLSVAEIKALDGKTVLATEAGRKIKSREEKVQDIKDKFGVGDTVAEWAVDNPAQFQEKLNDFFATVDK